MPKMAHPALTMNRLMPVLLEKRAAGGVRE